MERGLLVKAYDRSAEGYDERFRELQRVKFRAAAAWLASAGLCVDASGGTGLLLESARDEKPSCSLRPGGRVVVSFPAAEEPASLPLRVEARVPAGQDVVFALRKDPP
ncbi:MAG: hypothetical protein LC689_06930 [Myxococcales bacterium]|nr:hypothetical protein [Myxococcales bacterium]